VLVDQSILGKTPRSNPAVYIGAFDDIREVFAQSEQARQRGLNASAFSFNSAQGQCERCRGAGFEKIEMQFLSDIFIRCPDCNGRRYRPHILEVKLSPMSIVQSPTPEPRRPKLSNRGPESPIAPSRFTFHASRITHHASPSFSIADVLDSTVEEVIAFLAGFPESRPAQRAVEALKLLEEVGLGYLKLGQPINTLSGGESQRLKLVRHLAEAIVGADAERPAPQSAIRNPQSAINRCLPPPAPTLFLFDEPTTGLHFDDVRVLLKVFQRLVDAGHSVLVIEHNLDVMKSADWIIDLGPDAGDQGGQIVAAGTPEQIAACPESHTGKALRTVLPLPAASAKLNRQSSK
jgi:excinuclease ABC subunit A